MKHIKIKYTFAFAGEAGNVKVDRIAVVGQLTIKRSNLKLKVNFALTGKEIEI